MYRRFPRYPDDADYQTNAPSYYEDLARKNKLIKKLAKRIWEYDKILADSLEEIEEVLRQVIDKIGEGFNEEIYQLLVKWVEDGTLDHIINETLMNKKADKTYVDELNENVSAQLAQTKTELQNELKLRTYKKYGSINVNKFKGLQHTIDFNIYRDSETGLMKHDFEIDRTGYIKHYIKSNGSASADGKTEETANSRFSTLIAKIESDSTVQKAEIIVLDLLPRNAIDISLDVTLTKDYIITTRNNVPLGSIEKVTFNEDTGTDMFKALTTYKPVSVVRFDTLTVNGKPFSLKKVNSYNECLTTQDTYFHDGTSLYVHKKGTTTDNTVMLVSDRLLQFKLSGGENQLVILDNVLILNGSINQPCYFESDNGTTKGNVIVNNCVLDNYGAGYNMNGFSTNGIKDIKLFNCRAFNIIRDGFNYHNTQQVNGGGMVFEYNCHAENTGVDQDTGNNNISSAHDGIHIIRVHTTGQRSKGPLIADVNGCYSLNIDCFVSDTQIESLTRQNSAFYFDDQPGTYTPDPNGKAWLINCGGGSSTEWGINGDESFRTGGKIFIDNFKGTNIPDDVNLTLL